ncbi:hypothetical protein BC826DRAFT_1001762 [Russula brevipes]|nr:hypothetical protein BC826DRAFT_1001762 [Russula brevipes]
MRPLGHGIIFCADPERRIPHIAAPRSRCPRHRKPAGVCTFCVWLTPYVHVRKCCRSPAVHLSPISITRRGPRCAALQVNDTGPHAKRQASFHPHEAVTIPGPVKVLVPALGANRTWTWR